MGVEISIVVPAYRSAECLDRLVDRVTECLGERGDWELILVNDCSPDATWEVIARLADTRPGVRGVNLRKNVGQDNAIMAGLAYARGHVVVIMDDDLQHDPADVPRLCEEIKKGFDVVYAFFDHKEHALWKRLGSRFNGWAAVMVLGKPKHIYMSPYKAIRAEVVREILHYGGPYPYVDGLLFTVTSSITQVTVKHHARFAGASNYNLWRSIRVWMKLATGFSVLPLRVATVSGMFISVLSFLLAAYFVIETLLFDRSPAGWPSLIVATLFLGGIQLLGIGALGEYVGRVFMTQNQRPQYVVREMREGPGAPNA